jgi:FMN phosphatase YigB (HAD superfamily)
MTSFIYFDVGGVVIKDFSDSDKFTLLQQDIGINPSNQQLFDQMWQSHRDSIAIDYDIDNYLPFLREKINLNLPLNYSLLQDFVDRFEQNLTVWPIIKKLKQKYRLGLITNQYPRMFNKIQEANLLPEIKWDVIVDSSKVKAKKPDLNFYEIAADRAKVTSTEILLIDNKPEFLEPPKSLGWQTFYYGSADYQKSSQQLNQFLHDHKILL